MVIPAVVVAAHWQNDAIRNAEIAINVTALTKKQNLQKIISNSLN